MKTWDLDSVEVWLDGSVPENGIDIARLAVPDECSVPACVQRFRTTLTSRGEVTYLASLMGLRVEPVKLPMCLVHNHNRILYEQDQPEPVVSGLFGRKLPLGDDAEVTFDKTTLLRNGDVLSLRVEPAADVKHIRVVLFGQLLHPRTGKLWPDDFEPKTVYFEWDRSRR